MTFQQFMRQFGPILIIAGFSIVGWIIKQAQAQRAKLNAAKAREKAELEGLRTGQSHIQTVPTQIQPPATSRAATTPRPGVPSSAQASLEDIAARRRAKMEELQRRAAGSGASVRAPLPQPTTPPAQAAQQEIARVLGQILGVPTTQPPTRRAPAPPPPRPVPAARQRAQAQRRTTPAAPAPRRPVEERPEQPLAPRRTPSATRTSSPNIGESEVHALTHKQAPVTHDVRHPLFRGTDLRRLFVVREVLDKPITLRDE